MGGWTNKTKIKLNSAKLKLKLRQGWVGCGGYANWMWNSYQRFPRLYGGWLANSAHPAGLELGWSMAELGNNFVR